MYPGWWARWVPGGTIPGTNQGTQPARLRLIYRIIDIIGSYGRLTEEYPKYGTATGPETGPETGTDSWS